MMRKLLLLLSVLAVLGPMSGCGGSGGGSTDGATDETDGTPGSDPATTIVVNTLRDTTTPAEGETTLRAALEQVPSGGTIRFDPALNGQTIALNLVGEEHTLLKGEVMGFDIANNISYLVGYFDRDYGKSALYVRKNLIIDAQTLDQGITLSWTGNDDARVLAVYGDLIMRNVTITGGSSVAEKIIDYDPTAAPGSPNSQPWTLGRGGALAVWGQAQLVNCTLHDNSCLGDFDQSRDRGAFGGGLYADIVQLSDCVISGNSVVGAGAAGGGVYSVGGADHPASSSRIEQSSITGNRISGVFAYGGGAYSDGGGIGNLKTLVIDNTTIARNLVEPPVNHVPPFLLPTLLDLGYWRGGGLYMSNGNLALSNVTLVENQVYGKPRTDSAVKPNLAGGIAATIGNAHAVERLTVAQSIVTGNLVHEMDATGTPVRTYQNDIFTGSLLHFYSQGYNLVGQINFDHMLAPVPQWNSLSRRHWPKTGDRAGIAADAVLDLGAAPTHPDIVSRGVTPGTATVLWYPPRGDALDAIPTEQYNVTYTLAQIDGFDYRQRPDAIDDFLPAILDTLENQYGDSWAAGLYNTLGDPTGILWYGPAVTWPTAPENHDWIRFWYDLDNVIGDNLGQEKLGDAFWADFEYTSPSLREVFDTSLSDSSVSLSNIDQLGSPRSAPGDIGAIELAP